MNMHINISAAESSSRLCSSKLWILSGAYSARCDCTIFVMFCSSSYRVVKWNTKYKAITWIWVCCETFNWLFFISLCIQVNWIRMKEKTAILSRKLVENEFECSPKDLYAVIVFTYHIILWIIFQEECYCYS